MVRRLTPCPESQIPGAERAKRNAASEGAISHREDAQSPASISGGSRNVALELPVSGDPAYFYEAWTVSSHAKGQRCLLELLEKGKYFRNPLLLGKCLIAFQRNETQLGALYLGL